MATDDSGSDDLVVARPAPGTVVRHRGAEIGVRSEPDGPATIEVKRGAVWLRAVADGPGLVLSHGATTMVLRDGAAVVEVHDAEALLVVVAGRAEIDGSPAVPGSVGAGQAATLTADGGCSAPEVLAASELAADRMIVENLALDATDGLGSPLPGGPDGDGVAPAGPTEHEVAPDRDASDTPRPDGPGAPADRRLAAGRAPVDGDPVPGRRQGWSRVLLVVVVVALVAIAVVAAVLAFGDDDDTAPTTADPAPTTRVAPSSGDPAPTTGVAPTTADPASTTTVAPSTTADTGGVGDPIEEPPAEEVPSTEGPGRGEVKAAVASCRAGAAGYVVRGTVQGGGQRVARYAMTVGLVDREGEIYAEATERVAPEADRSQPAPFEVVVPVAAGRSAPGTKCEVLDAEPLRVAPR